MKRERKKEFTDEEKLYISLLKKEFVSVSGINISGDKGFELASTFIEEKCNEMRKITEPRETTIGYRALRRLWGKDEPERYTYERNLDSIAYSLGYKSWRSYVEIRKRDVALTSLFDPRNEGFDISKMAKGNRFILGWMPIRFVELEYLGDNQFRILNLSDNIKRKKGDIIVAQRFRLEYGEIYDKAINDGQEVSISGFPLYPKIILEKEDVLDNQQVSDYFFI